MAWQPSRLSAEQLEERRREAARLLRAGRTQAEVARELGVSPVAVYRWAKVLKLRGLRGLKHRLHPGRPSRLTPQQWKELARVLKAGALASGFDTDRWTLKRIASAIWQRFGVRYNSNYLAEPLHRLGFSPQRPLALARERDDDLVKAWLERDWPRIKKGLVAAGEPWPSWTRRVVRFGPGWAPHGHPLVIPEWCAG